MNFKVSYDIDGVLAVGPPKSEKSWGKMNGAERKARRQELYNHFASARQLLKPQENFIAVSARSAKLHQSITDAWMAQHNLPFWQGSYLLHTSRTVLNVAKHKSNIINHFGIERHYEDNKKVLRAIRKLIKPEVRLYFWEEGMEEPVLYEV